MPHDTLPRPTPAGVARPAWHLTLPLIAGTGLMLILDLTITNVALPTIQHALSMTPQSLQWVVNAYALAYGGLLLLGGRLADRLGRRRVFLTGVAVFTVASLLGGLAPTGGVLVAARGLQGLGAALAGPAGLSILTTTYAEGADRNRALGVWSAVLASGGALGMLAGGLLTEYASWRWRRRRGWSRPLPGGRGPASPWPGRPRSRPAWPRWSSPPARCPGAAGPPARPSACSCWPRSCWPRSWPSRPVAARRWCRWASSAAAAWPGPTWWRCWAGPR